MKSALPLTTVILALIGVWYLAAALMNASLQRDQFANAGRTDYSAQDLIGASLNMERPKLPAPHQVASELYKLVFATPPTSKRSLVYHGLITLEETLIGFADRLGFGHRACCSHRLHALARALDDAVDRGVADRADHCARAHDRGHPEPVQHHRHCAQGRDRRLSLASFR